MHCVTIIPSRQLKAFLLCNVLNYTLERKYNDQVTFTFKGCWITNAINPFFELLDLTAHQ